MSFKARLATKMTFKYNQPYNADGILDEVWTFSRTRVLFTPEQAKKFVDITLDPGLVKWEDKTIYSLHVDDIEPKYSIVLKEFFAVPLQMNWWNRQKMFWTHKRMYLQSEKSNWLKTPLVQQILAAVIAVSLFFVGKSYGYDQGYKKGVIEGKMSAQPIIDSLRAKIHHK
ncbi:MAG: hypothetical protein WDM78_11605 [Puia sp.]